MNSRKLETYLQYTFRDPRRLRNALCHRSYVNEHPGEGVENNERLEFLGDAVLNLVAGDLLMHQHPDQTEGDLSRMRAFLVNENQLADIARSLKLGEHILLGKGEARSNGHDKNSILADALEAVIAAVYQDGGFDAAVTLVRTHFDTPLKAVSASPSVVDFKSRLQEWVQTSGKSPPRYRVVDEFGPDHDKTFTVELRIKTIVAQGTGKSKKIAEQAAAQACLERLQDHATSHQT